MRSKPYQNLLSRCVLVLLLFATAVAHSEPIPETETPSDPIRLAVSLEDVQGAVLEGVVVTLQARSSRAVKFETIASGRTNTKGLYTIATDPVPGFGPPRPGAWSRTETWVHFQKPGYASVSKPLRWQQKPIQFGLGMREAASIRGVILDQKGEPVSGARVWADLRGDLTDFGVPGLYSAESDASGRYEIRDLLPIEKASDLAAIIDAIDSHTTDGSSILIHRPKPRCFYATHPANAAGRCFFRSVPDEHDFALDPARPVEGVVTDTGGDPVAGIEVFLNESGRSLPEERDPETVEQSMACWYRTSQLTDERGQFRFAPPPRGSYELRMQPPPTLGERQGTHVAETCRTLELPRDAEDRESINLRVSAGRTVRMRLVDSEGNPTNFEKEAISSVTLFFYPEQFDLYQQVTANQWPYHGDGVLECRLPLYAGKLSVSFQRRSGKEARYESWASTKVTLAEGQPHDAIQVDLAVTQRK